MERSIRKPLRRKNTDYSAAGAYFVTLCTKDKACLFGDIPPVGDGAPDVPRVILSPYGKIVEKEIIRTNRIYNDIKIDYSVIMPNHVHMIVIIKEPQAVTPPDHGTSRAPSPTVDQQRMYAGIPRVISTFKRFVNKQVGENVWQRSFFDRIIRNRQEYDAYCRYIYENPFAWQLGKHNETDILY